MQNNNKFLALILMAAFAGSGSLLTESVEAAGLTIVDKEKSRYHIVIAANALPSERYAAEELQRYVERMSGAKLPIVTDAEALKAPLPRLARPAFHAA